MYPGECSFIPVDQDGELWDYYMLGSSDLTIYGYNCWARNEWDTIWLVHDNVKDKISSSETFERFRFDTNKIEKWNQHSQDFVPNGDTIV